ncbi:sigma-54 interaction domain-containing protein [Cytobacillus sp. IB215665]|uniref:sigma-54 interaction domain-containing protein n=1 Tax=Cytobacillus sp. IB215665 TaxID=3097357 RepID=UPI002A0CF577|nr:sigma 54-interacting transcriptional regulator [Cytobacillus sp. IB215665]MDX8365459.1 sigma 54-interacting transcriptional regulator [Cytobacillus sp. IB215665]
MNNKEHENKLLLIFDQLVDEIDIGVHVIDQHGRTIIYNKKMAQIEGMEREDVLHKNLLESYTFQDQQSSTLIQALQHLQITRNVKQTYFNLLGKEITTINDTFPISDSKKQMIGAMEIAKDVTKLERLIRENMQKKGNATFTFEHILSDSQVMKELIETSKRATRTSSSVLIVGETGTGKELFAQSIHNGSSRSAKPFISQNCAALPDHLIEGLLFGTKKGAFTGAIERPGLFEQAEGGTLLLDEINSLNPVLQAKLLRALQEKSIRRIGDTKDTPIDVRIIATMNEDPIDAIAEGRLRKDLFYRLSVVSVFIPPLRDRKEDINLLLNSFIKKYNKLFGMSVKQIDEQVMRSFYDYDWPGNVRELEHIVEGAMNFIDENEDITFAHLPIQFRNKPQFKQHAIQVALNKEESFKTLEEYMNNAEVEYIKEALQVNDYNISNTAKALGMSRQSLQYRLRKYQINKHF